MAVTVALGVFLANPAPAHATDTKFQVTHAHSGGAGTIAVSIKGNIDWLNRSVRLYNMQIFVKGGECGIGWLAGYQTNSQGDEVLIDRNRTDTYCPYGDAWYPVPDITLDGSFISGGITRLKVQAWDETHQGGTWGTFNR
ncbi:hypothetical protein ABGB07_38665 [Micromonosporaceae bacterium B7E4]